MTFLAREAGNKIGSIPCLGVGTLQSITAVGAGASLCFFDIGKGADASTGKRIPVAPDSGLYLKCFPGDKVAAHDGSAGGVIANAVGENTKAVYVYYDSTAGTAWVMECT